LSAKVKRLEKELKGKKSDEKEKQKIIKENKELQSEVSKLKS